MADRHVARHGRVLFDADRERRLRRDGFVTFRAFDAAEVAGLRRRFADLGGFEGSGFRPDLIIADPTYRQAATAAISEALDERLAAQFDGYEPFLRAFLCKYPGPDSQLYLHQDWMYVDERTGARTYNCWVALEDIDGHNGQLQVLRGSHRIDPSLRGTSLTAPWIQHTSVIEPRLLTVPVRAGEVVLFDNALVHGGFPNLTERPRLAAAVAFHRPEDALVYFRREDDATAARYDVDEAFFVGHTAQGLEAEAPDLPVVERVAHDALDLDPAALAAELDAVPLARIDRVHRVLARRRAARRGTRTSA